MIGKIVTDDNNTIIGSQSLIGHSSDSVLLYKQILDSHYDFIKYFCKLWNINLDKLIEYMFIYIFCHDIGKCSVDFQDKIRNNIQSSKYQHALYSFIILDSCIDDPFKYGLFAVLGHHTEIYNGMYYNFDLTSFDMDGIDDLINEIPIIYDKYGFDKYFSLNTNFTDITITMNKTVIRNKLKEYMNRNNYENDLSDKIYRIKAIYTFVFSLLQTGDDYSSRNAEECIKYNSDIISIPNNYFTSFNPDIIIQKIKSSHDKLYPFQKELLHCDDPFVSVESACGGGKTEGSLLYAMNIAKNTGRFKLVYVLPSQTTCNNMGDVLKTIFREDMVGLYHSRMSMKDNDMYNIDDSNYEDAHDDINKEKFDGKVFHKPVTVTTIDHLMDSFIKNSSQSDFQCGNLQDSIIIFDEIHNYDVNLTRKILTQLFILRNMKIPHLVMSGTLPDITKDHLNNYTKVVDYERLKKKPFSIEYHKGIYLTNKIDRILIPNRDIINKIKGSINSKIQFIIVNTINESKVIYNALKEYDNVILYNSEFTAYDRLKKEKKIREWYKSGKPYTIIATQVIEISLDISCDIMYTDIAPGDAITQRGGRLNRDGSKLDCIMHVFDVHTDLPYTDSKQSDHVIMDRSRKYIPIGLVSYKDLLDWCNKIYTDKLSLDPGFHLRYRKNILFGDKNKYQIRDDLHLKLDVILSKDYTCISNLNSNNFIPVPIWVYKKSKDKTSNIPDKAFKTITKIVGSKKYNYLLCNLDYSPDSGLDYYNLYSEFLQG